MIGVSAHTVPYNFAVDMRIALQGMLHLFKNNDPGAFADYKTVPVFIKRPRSLLRAVIIGGGKSLERAEASESYA